MMHSGNLNTDFPSERPSEFRGDWEKRLYPGETTSVRGSVESRRYLAVGAQPAIPDKALLECLEFLFSLASNE